MAAPGRQRGRNLPANARSGRANALSTVQVSGRSRPCLLAGITVAVRSASDRLPART